MNKPFLSSKTELMKPVVRGIAILGGALAFEFRGLYLFICLVLFFGLLAVIDVATGYYKNEEDKRYSRKLNLGIGTRAVKIVIGIALFMMVSQVNSGIPDTWLLPLPRIDLRVEDAIAAFPIVLFAGWILSEIKSVFENLAEMGESDPISLGIPKFITKVLTFGAWLFGKLADMGFAWISDKFDAKAKIIAKIIEKRPDQIFTDPEAPLPPEVIEKETV